MDDRPRLSEYYIMYPNNSFLLTFTEVHYQSHFQGLVEYKIIEPCLGNIQHMLFHVVVLMITSSADSPEINTNLSDTKVATFSTFTSASQSETDKSSSKIHRMLLTLGPEEMTEMVVIRSQSFFSLTNHSVFSPSRTAFFIQIFIVIFCNNFTTARILSRGTNPYIFLDHKKLTSPELFATTIANNAKLHHF